MRSRTPVLTAQIPAVDYRIRQPEDGVSCMCPYDMVTPVVAMACTSMPESVKPSELVSASDHFCTAACGIDT